MLRTWIKRALAISKLDYAIKLRPDVADYLVTKANLLQCQLKLTDAVEAASLAEVSPLRLERVIPGTPAERRWRFYLHRYHYLGLASTCQSARSFHVRERSA